MGDLSKGGSSSLMRRASSDTRWRSSDAMAVVLRSSLATPDNTDQLCAMASIRHSSFAADPSGVPSSNHARLYQSPSQACASSAAESVAASLTQRLYQSPSQACASSAAESVAASLT